MNIPLDRLQRSVISRRVAELALAGVLLCVALSAFGWLFGDTWIGDIARSFSLHYLILAGLALIWIGLLRPGKAAFVTAFSVIFLAIPVMPELAGATEIPSSSSTDPDLYVMSFNVFIENSEYAKVVDLVQEEQPDIAFFFETSQQWIDELRVLESVFESFECTERTDTMGLCVGVVDEEAEVSLIGAGPDNIESAFVELTANGSDFLVAGTHPPAPSSPQATSERNIQLRAVADELAAGSADGKILVGDFNATSYSKIFNEVLDTGLFDVSQGRGFRNTWSKLPTLLGGLEIDHALVNENLSIVNFAISDSLGSDHHPLLLKVAAQNQGDN